MMTNYSDIIASELNITRQQVESTLYLLENGASVPFIARYRKEATGNLDEVQIAGIRDRHSQLTELDKRRHSVIESIREQEKLTPELEKQLNESTTLSEIEDIYLPYRPKRKTRATIAVSRGLEPLAKMLMAQNLFDIVKKAEEFIKPDQEVLTADDALQGARDIIAEWVNENKTSRSRIRFLFEKEGNIYSKVIKSKAEEGIKYKDYFDWKEAVNKVPSHRLLAMFRGENESFLRLRIEPVEEKAYEILYKIFIKASNDASSQVKIAICDSYKRLLGPSMETEIREMAKLKADKEAIKVFAENLKQLLLSPPLGQKNVLAIDPGFRTGCKLVCLDRQGNLLHNETIYPHPPESKVKEAINKIEFLVDAYKIEAIAIGNGTAGRETESFIKRIHFRKDIIAVMVNESGASVYSASAIARTEFPEYDVTVRGSVSIGRRLMDPLAELVKIDPKSIGVGQYQHDVDQKALQTSLNDIVSNCVNAVGVEVNTASKELLNYVSGVGESLSKNIIDYRKKNGPFHSREEFRKVPRFGEKAFEQAAGFLKIHLAENPLDSSAVHPESYHIVEKMAAKLGVGIPDLIASEQLRKKINLSEYITPAAGLPTLTDIMKELDRPGRDPRSKFDMFEFDKTIHRMEDLVQGMVVPGIVTNITAFGAFVDIGVHQDGLVHISQLADRYVKDPNEIVKVNQKVMVKVLEVDTQRKRIQLSMKV